MERRCETVSEGTLIRLLEMCGKEKEVEVVTERLLCMRARTDMTEFPSTRQVGKASGSKWEKAPNRKESERRAGRLVEAV